MILSADGHEVIGVSDGKAALDYLKDHTPDAMLLDVQMPLIDGFDICSRVKRVARLREIPVILLTGFDDDQTRERAQQVKADDLIYKPLSGKNLRARIRSVIERNRTAPPGGN
ncbi:DNA-binding response OmpR family regulator [Deinobacterium chartae]|uniref:DNA-binding response OmpR family regulator n=2 Tax=Deinobacterium chartae TaxID=521158 RepID=A0A841HXP4_9DEIO|nr:DNA-binding response OmpR family regulator [Deinobacterium chartae]